jgi:light-regulated signal transduction histidine kinase (bacteriophytochrome)
MSVDKKFKIDNELQHRRQNGFDNVNLFDKNLMFTYRIWAHYQHNKDVKFSLSPFAYFSNYKIIQKQTDQTASPISEVRLSAAVELQQNIFKKFYRIGDERTRQTKGSGLGLFIVKNLLNLLDARIYVKDNQPSGTIFEMHIDN